MHQNLKKAINYMIFQEPFLGSLLPRLQFIRDPNTEMVATNGKAIFWNYDYVDGQIERVLRADIAHEIFHCIMGHPFRRQAREPKKWNYACDLSINPLVKQIRNVLVDDSFLIDEVRFPAGMSAEKIYELLDDNEIPPQYKCTCILDAKGPSVKAEELDWKGAVAVAATNAKKAGKLSLEVEQLITEILDPKVPWQQLLYTWMTTPKGSYVTWERPNRHYLPHGIYLPGKRKRVTGSFVLVYDVSGSMSDQAITESLAEVRYIINEIHPKRVILIQHDAEITDVQEYESGEELPTEIELHGRGGTDFNPVFEYVNDLDEIPDAVIFFTDGYGPHPEYSPEYPVLWVMVETDSDLKMNFGEQIWLDP